MDTKSPPSGSLKTVPRTLYTDRLALRPIAWSDAAAYARLAAPYDVARMTGTIPHPFGEGDARARIRRKLRNMGAGREMDWAVERDGELIGEIGLRDKGGGVCLFGYMVGMPWWGRGYATEAIGRVIALARATRAIDMIEADVATDNPASERALLKSGFKKLAEPPHDEFSMARGAMLSCTRYELLLG